MLAWPTKDSLGGPFTAPCVDEPSALGSSLCDRYGFAAFRRRSWERIPM